MKNMLNYFCNFFCKYLVITAEFLGLEMSVFIINYHFVKPNQKIKTENKNITKISKKIKEIPKFIFLIHKLN